MIARSKEMKLKSQKLITRLYPTAHEATYSPIRARARLCMSVCVNVNSVYICTTVYLGLLEGKLKMYVFPEI